MGADVVEVQRLEQKKRDASIEKEARKAAQSQEIKSAIHQMALALDLPTWRIKSMLETAQLKVGGRQVPKNVLLACSSSQLLLYI